MVYKFESVIFDFDDNSFKIKNGTIGTYTLSSIRRCSILNEEAKFKGKTEPFLHQVLGGTTFFVIGENRMYVGLKLTTDTNQTLAIYISKKPVSFNSESYIRDKQEAERIKSIFDKNI